VTLKTLPKNLESKLKLTKISLIDLKFSSFFLDFKFIFEGIFLQFRVFLSKADEFNMSCCIPSTCKCNAGLGILKISFSV